MPPWQEHANILLKRMGVPQFGPPSYPDHWTASDLIDQIGADDFQQYFSFAFVRNPWDWELSHYKYISRQRRHPQHEEVRKLGAFSEYVRWRCDGRYQLQEDFVTLDDEVVVDFVGRFESLQTDFQYVCRQIGVLPKLEHLNNTRKTSYRDHYDDATAELVRRTYLSDVLRFGYRFDQQAVNAA